MRGKKIIAVIAAVVVVVLMTVFIIAESYDFNKFKPQIVAAVKKASGRDLNIGGDIDLKLRLSPSLVAKNVAFQNAAWGSQPEMIKVDRLEIQVALFPLIRGNIYVDKLILDKPDILIETDQAGRSNFEFSARKESDQTDDKKKPADDKLSAGPYFEFKKVKITRGRLFFNDQKLNRSFELNLNNFDAERKGYGKLATIEADGAYNKLPFKVSGTIGTLSGFLNSVEPWPLDLKIKIQEAVIAIKGTLKDLPRLTGLSLAFSAEAPEMADLQKITGKPLPLKGPFNASGHITTPAEDTIQIADFKVALAASQLNGNISVKLSPRKNTIKAKLVSPKLDLRLSLATEKTAKSDANSSKKDPKSKTGKVFPDTPLPLDVFHSANADLNLQVNELLLPGMAFDSVKTDVVLKDGHLKIKPIEAGIGEGRLTADIDFNARQKDALMTAALKIENLDLGKMLQKLDIPNTLTGILTFDLNLKGQGGSMAALMAGLNGSTSMALGDGKIAMEYMNLVGADLSRSLMQLLNPFKLKQEFMTINCMVCRFNIENGLAVSEVILMDADRTTIIGNGKIDLKTEQLDIGIKPKPKEGIGVEQTGKLSISLSELTEPFRLGGTLANPSLALSPNQTAITLGRALLGPAGIASIFVKWDAGDKHPCLAALKSVANDQNDKKAAAEKTREEPIKQEKQSITDRIKGLFEKK